MTDTTLTDLRVALAESNAWEHRTDTLTEQVFTKGDNQLRFNIWNGELASGTAVRFVSDYEDRELTLDEAVALVSR